MITLKLKLRNPSKGKLNQLTEYTEEFVGCVQWFLDKTLQKPQAETSFINSAEARHLFNLPSANIQVALDKAIEAYRSSRMVINRSPKSNPALLALEKIP